MLNISCPVCNISGGRALGVSRILIRCRMCKQYYLFVSDEKGKSVVMKVDKNNRKEIIDNYK